VGRETCFTDLEFLEDEMSHKFIKRANKAGASRDAP